MNARDSLPDWEQVEGIACTLERGLTSDEVPGADGRLIGLIQVLAECMLELRGIREQLGELAATLGKPREPTGAAVSGACRAGHVTAATAAPGRVTWEGVCAHPGCGLPVKARRRPRA